MHAGDVLLDPRRILGRNADTRHVESDRAVDCAGVHIDKAEFFCKRLCNGAFARAAGTVNSNSDHNNSL